MSTAPWVTEPTRHSSTHALPGEVALCGLKNLTMPSSGTPITYKGRICEWLQWPKIHGHLRSSKYYCHSFGANKEWMTNPEVWLYIDKVSGTKNPLSWYHVVFRDSICMSAMRPGVRGPSQVPILSPSLIRGSMLFPSFQRSNHQTKLLMKKKKMPLLVA